ELAVRAINLTRIESYPTGEQLGRYVFFLDCSGHVAEARLGEALQGLRRTCADVRFLGSYPRAGAGTGGTGTAPPAVADFADAEVRSATLNGSPLDHDRAAGRIRLPGLAADNELRVVADVTYSRTGQGLHRFTDPVDGHVYLYTQAATADAQRVFPCFDQPD